MEDQLTVHPHGDPSPDACEVYHRLLRHIFDLPDLLSVAFYEFRLAVGFDNLTTENYRLAELYDSLRFSGQSRPLTPVGLIRCRSGVCCENRRFCVTLQVTGQALQMPKYKVDVPAWFPTGVEMEMWLAERLKMQYNVPSVVEALDEAPDSIVHEIHRSDEDSSGSSTGCGYRRGQ